MLTLENRVMIKPAEAFGPALTSRFLGAELRAEVEEILERDGEVVIDFDGVIAVSPSFADEVFAKLPQEAVDSGQIRFENVSVDLQTIARYVIRARRGAASDS